MDLERQIKTTRSCTGNGDDPGVQSPDSAHDTTGLRHGHEARTGHDPAARMPVRQVA